MSNGKEATWPSNQEEEHGMKAGIATMDFTGFGTIRPSSIAIKEKELVCTLTGLEAVKLATNLMAVAMNQDIDFEDPDAITLTVRESKMELLSATILGKLAVQRTEEDKKRIQDLRKRRRELEADRRVRDGAYAAGRS